MPEKRCYYSREFLVGVTIPVNTYRTTLSVRYTMSDQELLTVAKNVDSSGSSSYEYHRQQWGGRFEKEGDGSREAPTYALRGDRPCGIAQVESMIRTKVWVPRQHLTQLIVFHH